MLFTVSAWEKPLPDGKDGDALLFANNWNDYGFVTTFLLVVYNQGNWQEIGGIKIGQFTMPEKGYAPYLPVVFAALDTNSFSLGQSDEYYSRLEQLGPDKRQIILTALRDIAYDLDLFTQVDELKVTRKSLLRDIAPTEVQGQLHRLAHGGIRLTEYSFAYQLTPPESSGAPSPMLTFEVIPESQPPTNIHVLIGRNGVGKTYLLHSMTRQLLAGSRRSPRQMTGFQSNFEYEPAAFANLVSVTFSAFDPFIELAEQSRKQQELRYAYIGLRRDRATGPGKGTPKSERMLAREFANSLDACQTGARRLRWLRALATLEADPGFREAAASELLPLVDGSTATSPVDGQTGFCRRAEAWYRRLSSGHKLVILTVTRLVEVVEERTLVLLDEPEAHLHPPLLAAFVRALSDLLIDRNGVAIIATHSPVVLQEVPRHCAWKLRRAGSHLVAERPTLETFGENVGILTREVFGLEVTETGYHQLLSRAIAQLGSYQQVLAYFEGALGAEARALVQALLAARSDS
jgi:hypothetical protein